MEECLIAGLPLALMSARRRGCREYSLASARRTSFLTICSCELAAVWWVSPSSWVEPSAEAGDEAREEGLRRRRAGGGEGEASACWESQLRDW